MSVLRFDPFRELDRWTEQGWSARRGTGVPFDAVRREHEVVLYFDLPGVDPDSIDLTVEKGSLTLTAQRASSRREGDEVVVSERPTGHFVRRLLLGEGLDTEAVRADYEAGVLTVVIPVAEAVRPRKVPVTAGSAKAVEGEAHGDQGKEAHAA